MKRSALTRKSRLNPISRKRRARSGQAGKLGIVRLYGPDVEPLRVECYERDGGKCVACGKSVRFESGFADSMHMAHKGNKRMYGDVIENVRTKCGDCHMVKEHMGGKVCPKKAA